MSDRAFRWVVASLFLLIAASLSSAVLVNHVFRTASDQNMRKNVDRIKEEQRIMLAKD